jgi:hypothetical protein
MSNGAIRKGKMQSKSLKGYEGPHQPLWSDAVDSLWSSAIFCATLVVGPVLPAAVGDRRASGGESHRSLARPAKRPGPVPSSFEGSKDNVL